ncbi:exocyst complex component EXO70H1-like protein [Tanacetum coccineum]|uniref:Exocyst subunit Exo70 family protein n=1 Tax=Tanacetum coccineum TaxID=301880 RepID=A0ABQ5DJR8_9ASTR
MSSVSSLRSSTSSSPYSSSSSESMMEENIKNAHAIIQKWEINGHFISIFHQDKTEEATNFVNCVKRLHRAMRFMASHDSISEKLTLAQGLMQIAMKRLETEFRLILLNIGEYLKPESLSISSVSSIDSEDEHLSYLRLIAETMISCGYGVECISVYKIIRKSTIDEALFHLGIQRYTSAHIKKLINTPCFDNHIKTWLNAVQIAVKTLFLEEKFLCDHVFASYQAVKDSCFQNSTNEAALSLFKFPEVIANTCCKRMDSESIFVMMNLHNSISDLWPEIESIFSNESVSSVKILALECLQKLAKSVRRVLSKLELSIHKNSSKITVSASGGIHPLNDSVMNYLSSLANYGSSLSDIIIGYDDLPVEQQSLAVSVKLERIILVLLCKLDRKAKFHDSTALSYLFLVNNLSFIIEKVRTTKLQLFIGNEWIVKHEMKLNQYALSYELTSWNKVIACLPKDLQVSPEKVRDCFRKFYFTFQEVCDRQISWIVVDGKMRDKMEASIVNKLVPMYEEFYGNHLLTLSEDEQCIKMLIRLSPENMVKNLSELFPGPPVVQ